MEKQTRSTCRLISSPCVIMIHNLGVIHCTRVVLARMSTLVLTDAYWSHLYYYRFMDEHGWLMPPNFSEATKPHKNIMEHSKFSLTERSTSWIVI